MMPARSAGLSDSHYPGRIATEEVDVVLDPLQGEPLVPEACVVDFVPFGGWQPAKHAESFSPQLTHELVSRSEALHSPVVERDKHDPIWPPS